MKPHPLRKEARALRLLGYSYKEIHARLGIGRSTLSYMLRDIVLTPEQQERLMQKRRDNAAKIGRAVPRELRVAWGKKNWENNQEQSRKNLSLGQGPRPGTNKRTRWSRYVLGFKTESSGVGDYVYILVPGHPMADKRGRVLEHRYVMSRYIGRDLTDEETVHHIDGDKRNNHIKNLELLADNAEHKKRHHPDAWVTTTCEQCGAPFTRSRRFFRGVHHFCSRKCSAKYYTGKGPLGRPAKPQVHGTNSNYHYRKCRCPECRAAHAKATRDLRRRNKNK
jgi:hypothetical protein